MNVLRNHMLVSTLTTASRPPPSSTIDSRRPNIDSGLPYCAAGSPSGAATAAAQLLQQCLLLSKRRFRSAGKQYLLAAAVPPLLLLLLLQCLLGCSLVSALA